MLAISETNVERHLRARENRAHTLLAILDYLTYLEVTGMVTWRYSGRLSPTHR